jgi:hypothetical protein
MRKLSPAASIGLLVTLVAARISAADAKAPDPDLPQPVDLKVAAHLLSSSPFTRPLDLSQSLALTGIAYVEGKPVATLTDKRTKQNYLVSDQPNALGWKLAEANASSELRFTQIKMYVGGEIVTIHYGDQQLAPSKGASEAARWRSLTDKDIIRTDEKGQTYIRGTIYLPDAERERYYNGWSRESQDKFRQIIQDQRKMMFNASHEERSAFAKKAFDSIDPGDKGRQGK